MFYLSVLVLMDRLGLCNQLEPFGRFSPNLHLTKWLPAGLVDPGVLVEPLTEERAARTLYRIELLRKIREQVGDGHNVPTSRSVSFSGFLLSDCREPSPNTIR